MKCSNISHLVTIVQDSLDIQVKRPKYFYSDSSQVRVRGQPAIVSRCTLRYAYRTG